MKNSKGKLMGGETYGEILEVVVDDMCRTHDRGDVFRRLGILKGHYYNVINPNKTTSSGNSFCCPVEWAVKATKESGNYLLLETLASDCGCVLLTPKDISELKQIKDMKDFSCITAILNMVQNIIKKVIGE